MTEEVHGVDSVEIAGDDVRVICHCGWKSKKVASEDEARELHTKHEEDSRGNN